MRVVGGKVRGRRLTPFKTSGIRPTSDRAREAIFNVLGQGLAGATVLDIFAGTGAMGLEALSRGAQSASFVDSSKGAAAIIKKNLTLCGFEAKGKVIQKDALVAIGDIKARRQGFDLIFIDAPYDENALTEAVLREISGSTLLRSKGRLICEVAKKNPIESFPDGLTLIKEKTYGDTLIYFLEAS